MVRPHQRAIDLLLPVVQALQDVDDDARFRVARLIDELYRAGQRRRKRGVKVTLANGERAVLDEARVKELSR